MAEARVDQHVSSEEILDVKRSLQEIISFFQQEALKRAVEDESVVFVPLRAQVEGLRTDACSTSQIISGYQDFTLDHIESQSDVNKISTFSEISEIPDGLHISPSVFRETKAETDFFMESILKKKAVRDGALENFPQGSFRPGELGESTDLTQSQYQGSAKNESLLDCIPCLKRLHGLGDLKPDAALLNLGQDLIENFKNYLALLESLFTNSDILNDICSLLNFFDKQCIPDLAGLLALLGLLATKYTDIFRFSGLSLAQLIGPLLSPVLGNISSLLDRYIQLILAPIDCILESLDETLARLDVEQGVRSIKQASIKDHIERIRELRDRKSVIEIKLARLKIERGNLKDPANPKSGNLSEINSTNGEIAELEQQRLKTAEEIRDELTRTEQIRGRLPSGATTFQEARGKLADVREFIGSSLDLVRKEAMKGRNFVLDKAQTALDEVDKLINFKTSTGFSSIEAARNLQRLSRLSSIIIAIISAHKNGKSLCQSTNDPNVALGLVLRNISSTNSNLSDQGGTPFPQLVTGHLNNEPHLVVLPPGAALRISGADSNLIDLNDIRKFNISGALPDIGGLAGTKIAAIIPGSDTSVKPVIIPFDLCKKSDDENAKQNVKDWISELSG